MKKLTVALSSEDPNMLANILEQLNQIVAGTHMAVPIQAPKAKTKTKGRPALKRKQTTSTRRNPSAYEIVEAKLKKDQIARSKRASKAPERQSKRIRKTDTTDEEADTTNKEANTTNKEADTTDEEEFDEENKGNNEDSDDGPSVSETGQDVPESRDDETGQDVPESREPRYTKQIPQPLKSYVKSIFDPLGDGNCGFRCVVKALGYDNNGWFRVRNKMLGEISAKKALYTILQGGALPIKTIINGLKVENLKSKIKRKNWLDKFSHGQILANVYQRPICFISLESCASFLPLRTGPGSNKTEPVYLLYVNGNHWALALVEGEDGVKPIPPPILATKNTLKCAKAWYNHVQKGMDLYQDEATKAT
ncbi:hypothetical protein PTTG_05905 [Puccinia triticina 1-1 BBBD Race 1]|uniref:OTU domain-containing protein n=1 Tax=Puccinia triticina (isolate 1-1 / race 1 (BBBD)) TaxID=630390 RepID=A0A180GYD5_PUCT1|nr:hypothetical protein PTTG_05905 [Puccinia triticina 1-1 BBBD Race 1]